MFSAMRSPYSRSAVRFNKSTQLCVNLSYVIFKLQKWAIRTISNSHYRSHTGPLFSKFNILNVHDTFMLNLGILCIDITQINFHQSYFTKHVQIHNYPTRNAQDYSISKTKKMFSDCAIRNCGPTFWNSWDKTVKHCKTIKHFRNQLKSILLSGYNWLHFGACLVYFCVLCLFVKCIILQVSVYLCWNLC